MSDNLPDLIDEWAPFKLIHGELEFINRLWLLYEDVYDHSKDRIGDINRVAGGYFYVVQRAMQMDAVRRLMAILDPSQQGRKQNASLMMVVEEAKKLLSREAADELDEKFASVSPVCERVRLLRSKDVIHFDLKYRRGDCDRAGAKFGDIREILDHVNDVVDFISQQRWGRPWVPDMAHYRDSREILSACEKAILMTSLRRGLINGSMSADEVARQLLV